MGVGDAENMNVCTIDSQPRVLSPQLCDQLKALEVNTFPKEIVAMSIGAGALW